jgi:general secretion pathway protein N
MVWFSVSGRHRQSSNNDSTATVFPGRFEWTLSRWIVLGEVNARITNPQLLEHALTVIGDWRTWHVNQLMLRLPASQLAMFGAPLNTLKPSGQMRVLAQALIVRSLPEGIEIHGAMQLQLNEIASVLSPVKPLGNYRVEFEWQGKRAQLTLSDSVWTIAIGGQWRTCQRSFTFFRTGLGVA